MFSCLWRFFIR